MAHGIYRRGLADKRIEDKGELLDMAAHAPDALRSVRSSHFNDLEFMKELVGISWELIRFSGPALRDNEGFINNKELMLLAVPQSVDAISGASESLWKDKDVQVALVRSDARMITRIPTQNVEYVFNAIVNERVDVAVEQRMSEDAPKKSWSMREAARPQSEGIGGPS